MVCYGSVINNQIFTCEICGKVVKGKGGFFKHKKIHNFQNHKVQHVKKLDFKEDVYCLVVEKYHNFAISSGVFVHNCGMCAIKTSIEDISKDQLKKIMSEIRKEIPLGFNKHKEKQDEKLMPLFSYESKVYKSNVIGKEYEKALYSLGTLGGGNHFIEIQRGSDNFIWIMIHSGSRNLGKQVADFYNKAAISLNEKWYTQVPKEHQLAFLPLNSNEGQEYLSEMNYCVEYALNNRKLMLDRIISIFKNEVNKFEHSSMINIAHNYAQMENHYGQNVIIHRKGATLARDDTMGIIPGSQGTKSYIVKGLGNSESFMSCSHGAGRIMGRKQAIRTLSLEKEKKFLDDQGIIHAIRSKDDLDEASGSYKNIEDVMKNQMDLVQIITELTPLAVIKG